MHSTGKPVVTWDLPDNADGLSAFFVYRKVNEDGKYEVAKILQANKTEWKDTKSLEVGNWYYYKVLAYYQDVDCYSIPAHARYNNEYFVKVYWSPDSVDENITQNVEIYPNPAKDLLTIKAENITNVMIYNSIGQKVYEKTADSSEVSINLDGFDTGIYLVKIAANGDEIIRKISIQK